jgi:glutamate-ammonia-ligase adenylyltransferase
MVTAMTAPMSQGKLYEIDMRLRPSGNQGPVATSLASFDSYQRSEAWVWEHLALTRADVVAGPSDLAVAVHALRDDILARPTDRDKALAEVAEMRSRIAQAKAPAGPWDAKIGPGRLQDIELLAQAGALLAGTTARHIPDGLTAACTVGLIDKQEAETLKQAYTRCWALQCAGRLLSAEPLGEETLGQAGAGFLARTLNAPDLPALEVKIIGTYDAAAAVIDRALSGPEGNESA